MERTKQKRKRLNLAVKREIQIWMLRWFLFAVGASAAVGVSVLYGISHREIGEAYYSAHLTIRHVSDLLLPAVAASGVLCVLVGTALLIFFPQRVAGPIYRMEQELQRVAQGDYATVVRLRRGDRFHSTAEALNRALQRVREDLSLAVRVEEVLSRGDHEEAKRLLRELKERIPRLDPEA